MDGSLVLCSNGGAGTVFYSACEKCASKLVVAQQPNEQLRATAPTFIANAKPQHVIDELLVSDGAMLQLDHRLCGARSCEFLINGSCTLTQNSVLQMAEMGGLQVRSWHQYF